MSETLTQVQHLIAQQKVRISRHGYNELVQDRLFVDEVVTGAATAIVVEDYPDDAKGPCVLVLQRDRSGTQIHVLWGVPSGKSEPAVLITAYRPDPTRWDAAFLRRKS